MRCRTQICTFMLLHLSCVSRLVFVEGVFVHCILHFGLQYLGGVSLCICIFTAAFLALKLLQPLSRILRGTKSQNSNLLQCSGRFLQKLEYPKKYHDATCIRAVRYFAGRARGLLSCRAGLPTSLSWG